ncbi:N-acylglucosamine-6-phosphate 2-epimerase [Pullulanibacillus pueri]|uniref:Putative N-acetylmannosamine-6-phosphate 2-epimerase n=1 Tax=Pullulanibacillus pueri TaxID=1437324 RepID=A0A8J2ZZ67_9BACL|nr:N-acetylmannosamine-6-phosphate 2-epimerase [Pullulanibacillus pueri]MBM7683656.1 N-acylglucosamine-6-phosphate 2-epimerase [Pullulanibacillus pueri]GGH87204.1 putative N-acetylmannosamine-6-phosphate 2-epimerase [Pullulanibacillus pueri]
MILERLKGGLVVSCQAHFDHPFNRPSYITALAQCAELGGAVAIRANGVDHISAIKNGTNLPVIGIYKEHLYDSRFFITPTLEHAKAIVKAGANIVALEATFQNQPNSDVLRELIKSIKKDLNIPVMADISTFDEGLRAWEIGVDLVGTTLSGYTDISKSRSTPDFELVSRLSEQGVRTVCEGHIKSPKQARKAIDCGAFFAVVGTAITDPLAITTWYREALTMNKDGEVIE